MGVGRLLAHACSNSEKKFMSYNLKGLTGLVVSDHDSNRRMLFNILKVLGIKEPQIAQDVVSGFRMSGKPSSTSYSPRSRTAATMSSRSLISSARTNAPPIR